MDSENRAFHNALAAPFENVPARRVTLMPQQQIVPWTPPRLLAAAIAWVMTETYIPSAAQADRRA